MLLRKIPFHFRMLFYKEILKGEWALPFAPRDGCLARGKKQSQDRNNMEVPYRRFILLGAPMALKLSEVSLSGQLNFCAAKLHWRQVSTDMRY